MNKTGKIVRKADRITLERTNALLYKKIIEWEKDSSPSIVE